MTLLVLCIASAAEAAPCSVAAPLVANAKTDVVYDPVDSTMKACVAGTWLTMASGGGGGGNLDDLTDVVIATPSTNQALVYNGAAWVNATLSLTETDPKVGTLTNGKWCTTNGTLVNCTQDSPLGMLTNGKWCTTDGTKVVCTSDAPTVTAGADTQVIFNSGGTLAGDAGFVWDNTNKRLGLGAANPDLELHIDKSVGAGLQLTRTAAGTATETLGYVRYGNVSADTSLVSLVALQDGAADAGQFVIRTQPTGGTTTDRLTVDSDGNVGIGTTSPIAKLHIELPTSGYVQYTDALRIYYPDGYPQTSALSVKMDDYTSTSRNLASFESGATSRFVIRADGNVGIGTTAPAYKLDVAGGLNIAANTNKKVLVSELTSFPNLSGITANGASLGFSRASDGIQNIAGMALLNDAHLFLGAYNDLIFGSGANSPFNNAHERMRITSAGNVGIGTVSPSNKLAIDGGATPGVSQLKISANGAGAISALSYAADNGYIGFDVDWAGSHIARSTTTAAIYKSGGKLSFQGDGGLAVGSGSPMTSRMTIDLATGNVGIGTNTTGSRLSVGFNGAGAVNAALVLNDTSASGSGIVFARFQSNGTTIGSVTQSGASAVVYNTTSDRRLKKDIVPTQRGLQELMKIEVDDFQFLSDPKEERVQGFIAQQLQEVYPEAVTVGGADAQTQPWTVDYGRVTPLLVKAMQELKAANDNLKTENAQLRTGLDDMRREVDALKSVGE